MDVRSGKRSNASPPVNVISAVAAPSARDMNMSIARCPTSTDIGSTGKSRSMQYEQRILHAVVSNNSQDACEKRAGMLEDPGCVTCLPAYLWCNHPCRAAD